MKMKSSQSPSSSPPRALSGNERQKDTRDPVPLKVLCRANGCSKAVKSQQLYPFFLIPFLGRAPPASSSSRGATLSLPPASKGASATWKPPRGTKVIPTPSSASNRFTGRTLIMLNYTSGHCSPVRKILLDEKNKVFYTCADDQTLRVWDISTFEELACIWPRQGQLIMMTQDRLHLYVCTSHRTTCVFSKKKLELVVILEGHTNKVWSVNSSHPEFLFTGGFDAQVMVYSKTNSMSLIDKIQPLPGPVTAIATDGKHELYLCCGKVLRVYNIKSTFNDFVEYQQAISTITSILWTGKYVVTGCHDASMHIYKTNSSKKKPLSFQTTLKEHAKSILTLESDGDKLLYSGSLDGSIRVYKLKNMHPVAIIKGRIPSVWTLAVHEKLLFIGSSDRRIRIISKSSFKRKAILEGRPNYITDCVSDRFTIFGASSNGNIYVWHKSFPSGFPKVIRGHKDLVRTLCVDSKNLYSGSLDHTLRVYDKSTLAPQAVLVGHQEGIRRIFRHETLFFSFDYGGVVAVWNVGDNFKLLERLERPWTEVKSLSHRPKENLNWITLGLTGILCAGYDYHDFEIISIKNVANLTAHGILLQDPKYPTCFVAIHTNAMAKKSNLPESLRHLSRARATFIAREHKRAHYTKKK